MEKLRTFFYSFRRSLVDPTYYSEFAENDSDFSFRYILGLNTVTYLIMSIILIIVLGIYASRNQSFFEMYTNSQIMQVPPSYNLSLQNQHLATSTQDSITFDFPDIVNRFLHLKKSHLLLLAPEQSIEDYDGVDSIILINQDAIVYKAFARTRILFFANFPLSIHLSRSSFDSVVVLLQSIFKFWYLAVVLIAVVLLGISALLGLVWTFLQSAAIFFVAGIFYPLALILRKKVTYSGLFHILLQGLSWPITLALIYRLFSPSSFILPGFYVVLISLVYLGWMIYVIVQLKPFHQDLFVEHVGLTASSTEPPLPKNVSVPVKLN